MDTKPVKGNCLAIMVQFTLRSYVGIRWQWTGDVRKVRTLGKMHLFKCTVY